MGFGVVGLTGGIGSGKSTVARFFREAGVPVVDADEVARAVVEPGTEGLAAVVKEFGDAVLAGDGTLDRAKLAELVFGDEVLRRRLESILHPLIALTSAARFAELASQAHTYVIYEAALLVENRSHRLMAALVVVATDEETQVERVRARDELDEEAARARIAAQLPLAEKIEVADYVIHNDGDLSETQRQTVEVHRALTERFGSDA